MHNRSTCLAVPLAIALASCTTEGSSAAERPSLGGVPSAVECTDAPVLRQRAEDNRGGLQELASDQAKIDAANSARFLASLAIIADLKCRTPLTEADQTLMSALELARNAANMSSFYQRAVAWNEANDRTLQVISMLVDRLPAARAD